jgi:RecB family exonuclease
MTLLADEPRALQNMPSRTPLSPVRPPHSPDQTHISASQLRSFSNCPLAWNLSRTHCPEHVSASLVFGSAFHAAAEHFYQMRLEGQSATFQDLMETYDAEWQKRSEAKDGKQPPPVKYSAKATGSEELRETASRMLEAFLAHAAVNVGEVIAVEEEFLVPMTPGLPALKGRIDLIEIRRDAAGDRQIHIVDFKTSAKRMNSDDVDRDQMDLYALAVRQTGLLDELRLPLTLRVDVVTKTKEATVTPIPFMPDPRNEKRVIAKSREIWKSMSSGVCYPSPGWQCSGCGYKALCAKWPDIPHETEKDS